MLTAAACACGHPHLFAKLTTCGNEHDVKELAAKLKDDRYFTAQGPSWAMYRCASLCWSTKPGYDNGRVARTGRNLFYGYLKSITGDSAKKIPEATEAAMTAQGASLTKSFNDKLAAMTKEETVKATVQFVQELGSLVALFTEAGLTIAEEHRAHNQKVHDMVKLVLQTAIVGIGIGLAAACPPAIAAIPPAVGIGAEVITDLLITVHDRGVAVKRQRGAYKAKLLGGVTAKVSEKDKPERDPTIDEISERMFYNGLYIAGWDVIPDLCAEPRIT